MAISHCKTHGKTISSLLTEEAFNLYRTNTTDQHILRVSESIEGDTNWGQTFIALNKELIQLGFPESLTINTDNEEPYEDIISTLKPICSNCFYEWVDQNNIEIKEISLPITL